MDSRALIHWQLQFTVGLIILFNESIAWNDTRTGRPTIAKSLILKDTKKVVILLFHSCICTNTQRPPKVNFYYVTQQGRIRIYPEFKRFPIRTKGELISDLILRLLGFADLGYKLRLLEKAGSL